MDTYDYIIVGAGSAGSVLASKLSENPTVSVCVLEAGPSDWHPYIHLPAGFIKTFYDSRVNWCYSMEPSEWTGGRRVYAPRGKTLGGSSSINGHVYNRGQRGDYDTWSQFGNRGWSYSDVLPYFRSMEQRIGVADSTYRGRDGKLTVTDINWNPSVMRSLYRRRADARYSTQSRLQRTNSRRRRLRAAHDPQWQSVSVRRRRFCILR